MRVTISVYTTCRPQQRWCLRVVFAPHSVTFRAKQRCCCCCCYSSSTIVRTTINNTQTIDTVFLCTDRRKQTQPRLQNRFHEQLKAFLLSNVKCTRYARNGISERRGISSINTCIAIYRCAVCRRDSVISKHVSHRTYAIQQHTHSYVAPPSPIGSHERHRSSSPKPMAVVHGAVTQQEQE